MKKLIMFIIVVLMLAIPALSWAVPGSCVQTQANYPESGMRKVIFTCTGSSVDGSIPNTDTSAAITSFIKGYQLFQVDAYPTSGGTAPDEANVFILDAKGLDLLGSEDGGTTAYEGLKLIHATLVRTAIPSIYLPRAGVHLNYFPYVTGTLTLKVTAQATVSANYTVGLYFWREAR
jgi:hypothetical protein